MFAWGDNASGELGTGTTINTSLPVAVGGLDSAVAIASGGLHTVAALSDGTVVAWGSNYAGQLGEGTTRDRSTPAHVDGLDGIGCPTGAPRSCSPVAAGGAHSLALRTDGTVMAWGADNFGQLGDGTTRDTAVPVVVRGLTDVVAISAGGAHSLALMRNGTVMAWGDDAFGQLGNGTVSRDPFPTPAPVVVHAAAPGAFIPLTGATAVSAGLSSSFAVEDGGRLVGWGNGGFGRLGDGGTPAITTPYFCQCRATPTPVLTRPGAVHRPPPFPPPCGPATCEPLTGVAAMSSSKGNSGQSIALLDTGAVVAWGANFEGQLGIGFTGGTLPVAVPVCAPEQPRLLPGSACTKVLVGITAVAAGGGHNVALKSDGTVVAWGRDFVGELGDGNAGPHAASPIPVQVRGLVAVTSITAGGSFSVAVSGLQASGEAGRPNVPAKTSFLAVPAAPPAEGGPPANTQATPTTPGVTSTFPPVLAANPTNPNRLAMAYSDRQGSTTAPPGPPGDTCRLSLSSDGGRTWASRAVVGSPEADFPLPPRASDPSKPSDACGVLAHYAVAFGPDGTLYYAFTASEGFFSGPPNQFFAPNLGSNGRVFLMASHDGGASFSRPQQLDVAARPPCTSSPPRPTCPPGLSGGDQDYVRALVIDQETGDVYVGFVEFSLNHPQYSPIRIVRCSPSGQTLPCGPAVQATPDAALDGRRVLQLAVGDNSRLYLAWTDETELFASDGNVANGGEGNVGPVEAKVVVSTDHGRTFGEPTVADRVIRVCPLGACPTGSEPVPVPGTSGSPAFYSLSIAAGPQRAPTGGLGETSRDDGQHADSGSVFTALSGVRFGGDGKSRIAVSTSDDGGATWGGARGLGVLAGRESHQQHGPGLARGDDGRLELAYYDRGPDGRQDVYLTSSRDGVDFSPPRRLTTVPSVTSVLQRSDTIMGVSVASAKGRTDVAWLDGRFGTPGDRRTDSFFASVAHRE